MAGFLASQGIRIGEKRVGAALKRVNPRHHHVRLTQAERQTNPTPYCAKYFGEKIHIDQNEKLVHFGVVHVCAIDGFSGRIVGFATMPVKNCKLIYQHLYM